MQKQKTKHSLPEILPPLKGQNIQSIYDAIDPLMEFNPPFIDVTYHREEYVYKELDNGLRKCNVIRKRPGTVGIAASTKYNVERFHHFMDLLKKTPKTF